MSPLLYILVAEALSNSVKQDKNIKGVTENKGIEQKVRFLIFKELFSIVAPLLSSHCSDFRSGKDVFSLIRSGVNLAWRRVQKYRWFEVIGGVSLC